MDPIDAISAVIRDERGRLVGVARKEGLAAEDAVECVQETFSAFLQIVMRGDAPKREEWARYLAGMARNTARNRRRRHHLARPHEEIGEVGDGQDSPEEMLARAEEHVRLRACVDQLCGTQRSVVMLRMLEERDGEDVATALGITRGHVDVLLHRAKASLRACMTD